jgi:hypothetical protein
VKVGGDFMAGRFFLPPFVVAVAILASWLSRRQPIVSMLVGLAAAILLFVPGLPWWLRSPAGETQPTVQQIDADHGIVDERRMHYGGLGLWSPTRQVPVFGAMETVVFPQGRTQRWFLLNGSVGTAGFQMGSRGHLVDPLLCDPLIARLPARNPQQWRIGHILRRIPEGYWESLRSGENELHHPGLRAFYGALRTATRGNVFAGERWQALWQLAVGTHDAGFREFVASDYRTPPRLSVPLAQVSTPLPVGVFWFEEPQVKLCYDGGLAIDLGGEQNARSLRLQVLEMSYRYRLTFRRSGQALGEAFGVPVPAPSIPPLQAVAGLHDEVVAVPAGVGAYDAIWIDPVETPQSDKAIGPRGIGALMLER